MTTLLQIELEHSDGEILSASISNKGYPVFIVHLNETIVYELEFNTRELATYLQEKEKEDSENNKIP